MKAVCSTQYIHFFNHYAVDDCRYQTLQIKKSRDSAFFLGGFLVDSVCLAFGGIVRSLSIHKKRASRRLISY